MLSRLTLTLPPAFENRTVAVETKRFSIGRTPENDLSIEDTSLSRRHALIEEVDGRYNLSDCGSSNGTFVNGRQITSSTELSDWDVLTFGGIGDILVRIERDESLPEYSPTNTSTTRQAALVQPVQPLDPNVTITGNRSLFSTPVLAGAAAVIIVLISGVILLVINASNKPSPSVNKKPPHASNNRQDDSATDASSSTTASDANGSDSSANTVGTESAELLTIEASAAKVLTGISRDTHPVLTEKPLSEINVEVKRYHGSSSLQEQIRSMRRALPQVSAIAKAHGIRTPLAVYATLAIIDRNGGRGDPVQIAATLCPSLSKMRAVFGDELANDSLLAVAALEEGPALLGKITKLAGRVNDSPTTIRSVWYLHDHEVISDQTYRFVLRFMSIGVIAQDPQKFGISADPLVF